jgi:hypothetical protein
MYLLQFGMEVGGAERIFICAFAITWMNVDYYA